MVSGVHDRVSEILKMLQLRGIKTFTHPPEFNILYWLGYYSVAVSGEEATIIDCGTYCGASAIVMCYGAIDRLNVAKKNNSKLSIISIEKDVSQFNIAKEHIQNLNLDKYIELQNTDDVTYLRAMERLEVITCVFHDSLHKEEHLNEALEASWGLIKHNGVISGHDYFFNEPGVMRAVDVFYNRHKDEIYGWNKYHSIWWGIKNESVLPSSTE